MSNIIDLDQARSRRARPPLDYCEYEGDPTSSEPYIEMESFSYGVIFGAAAIYAALIIVCGLAVRPAKADSFPNFTIGGSCESLHPARRDTA